MPGEGRSSVGTIGPRSADICLFLQDLQGLGADSGDLQKFVEAAETPSSGARGQDSGCEGRPNPRDLLQFLDLCPIQIETAARPVLNRVISYVCRSYVVFYRTQEAFANSGDAHQVLGRTIWPVG